MIENRVMFDDLLNDRDKDFSYNNNIEHVNFVRIYRYYNVQTLSVRRKMKQQFVSRMTLIIYKVRRQNKYLNVPREK